MRNEKKKEKEKEKKNFDQKMDHGRGFRSKKKKPQNDIKKRKKKEFPRPQSFIPGKSNQTHRCKPARATATRGHAKSTVISISIDNAEGYDHCNATATTQINISTIKPKKTP